MHRVLWLWLIALTACDPPATTAGAPTATTAPTASPRAYVPKGPQGMRPQGELPRLREEQVRENLRGVVTAARMMLSKVTTTDGVSLAFELRLPPEIASEWLAENAFYDGLRIHVTRGTEGVILRAKAHGRSPGWRRLQAREPLVLRATPDGLSGFGWMRSWEKPASWLGEPGRLRLRVEGEIPTKAAGSFPFATADLEVEIVEASPSFRAIPELAHLAARATVERHTVSHQIEGLLTIDDVDHNRWLWFRSRASYGGDEHFHALVAPEGKLIAWAWRRFERCIAQGTLIATPTGAVAIEELAAGDPVIAWDGDREVVAHVTRLALTGFERTIDVDGLRLTPEHEVLTGDEWRPAGTLRSGDLLRGRGGLVPLVRIDPGHRLERVYGLSVTHPHNYFADGVLVHNKSAPRSLPMTLWQWWFDRPVSPTFPRHL